MGGGGVAVDDASVIVSVGIISAVLANIIDWCVVLSISGLVWRIGLRVVIEWRCLVDIIVDISSRSGYRIHIRWFR